MISPVARTTIAFTLLFLTVPALAAQSTCLRVERFGEVTGAPASQVPNLELSLTEGASGEIVLRVAGGTPGKTAGMILGFQEIDLPLLGARLHVLPVLLVSGVFNASGEMTFVFPIQRIPGVQLLAQALELDVAQLEQHFLLTDALRIEAVPSSPASGEAFDLALAQELEHLSNAAYSSLVVGQSGGPTLPAGWEVTAIIEETSNSTYLFVARNETCDVVVSFRGTQNAQNWITNLNITQLDGFHQGFLLAYRSIEMALRSALFQQANNGAGRVYFTGHSLGGALGTVASWHLVQELAVRRMYPQENVVLYSFGAPRSMATATAAGYPARVPHHYAVASYDDIVTHNPGPGFGYAHAPRMRVLFPFTRGSIIGGFTVGTNMTLVEENGAEYDYDFFDFALTPGVPPHSLYATRLQNIVQPSVSLSVAPGGLAQLDWSYPARAGWSFGSDFIALYQGDPHVAGTNGFLAGQLHAASAGGSHVTTISAAAGNLYVAYVQQRLANGDRQLVTIAGPY